MRRFVDAMICRYKVGEFVNALMCSLADVESKPNQPKHQLKTKNQKLKTKKGHPTFAEQPFLFIPDLPVEHLSFYEVLFSSLRQFLIHQRWLLYRNQFQLPLLRLGRL